LEALYRRVERWVEGPREVRMRRAHGPWTLDRVWRRVTVHAAWIIVSMVLAHVFLSYFVSLRQLVAMVRENPAAHPEAFLVVTALASLLYFDFSWFREQFCVVLCPYGRLQSVLVDADSLVVGYDAERGEPRGKVKDAARGACVDCGRCVAVCPTGIDIRNGLQMDCVACTQCIDACDEIMDRVGQARGLVRYDSTNGLAGRPKRVVRSRVAVYALLGAVGLVVAASSFGHRSTFEANVLRLQGAPYVIDDGVVRDSYRIHLFNKDGRVATFHIEPIAAPNTKFILPMPDVRLASLAETYVPLMVEVPRRDSVQERNLTIEVRSDAGASRRITVPFLGPRSSAGPTTRGTP
jgi:cytochrome c oxidase accessory protein FixG